jgi:hypothetical protein
MMMLGRSLTTPLLAIPVALVLLLGACGSSTDSSDSVSSSPATASSTTSTSSTLLVPPTTTTIPDTTTSSSTTSTTSSTSTTFSTTTSTSSTTTTTTEPGPDLSGLVLSGDGIGPVQFGADADGVVDYLTSFLGVPTHDTGWVDPFEIGLCPGAELRLVSWGVLTVTLGDESEVASGRRHFVAYSYGIDGEVGLEPEGLETEEGITIGSSVADLVAAYPDVFLIEEDDFAGPSYVIDESRSGYLTGLADDDLVTVIFGGQGCGE